MRNISLKSVSARLSVTLLLLMGSMSASAQYYLNVYEKTGSNNQYEIANLDSVSISDVKEYIPVLTVLRISQSQVNIETGASTTLTVKGYDADGAEMTLEDLKWKSSDYSVASVDENGVVRTYHSGNAVITALVGDISVSCSVVVTDHVYTVADVVKITLDKDALKLETGQSASISAVGFSLNGIEIPLNNVVWKSSNTSVASVEGDGLIKTYASGVSEIIALFGTISDTCVITVADHVYTLDEVVEIIIDKDTLNFETGESGKLSVRGFAANGVEIPLSNIVWKSSDYSLASVDVNGAVRTYKSGSANIVASLGDVTDTCAVIIKDHVYTLDEVVKLSLDKVALNVETGVGDSLSVRGYAADGVEVPLSNIQWKSDNLSVATVTDNGVVNTLKSGKALIIVSLGNVSDTCTVTVVDHIYTLADVVKIAINKDTLYLETGQIDTLRAIGLATTGVEIPLENILWKSSNPSIATIDDNGLVRTSNAGKSLITASFGINSDTCVLIVVDHVYTLDEVTKLTIDNNILNLETGDDTTLIVKGFAVDGVEIPLEGVVWESTNPSVASVSESGMVTAIAKGNTNISAILNGLSVSCVVNVKDKFVAIDVTIDSLAKSGVYMGVMGFNKQLYSKPISILNTDSKNTFDTFVDNMEMKNGTLLCFAVDNAIDSLGSTVLPDNLSKVAVVTFTDGLDQGSIDMIEAVTGQYYDSDDEYLDAIKRKISTYSLAGIPITAYSVGVKGSDVKDLTKFQSTLKQLASSNEYAIEVNNMSELNRTFKAIADTLNRARNYQTVPIVMPGLSNGTRVRFTFDNVSDANKSTLYIEGTYNRRERTLTDVVYYGMSSTSGSVVAGEISEVIFTKFTFESILTNDNTFINKTFINEWYMTSDGVWQVNSEFDPDQQPDIELVQSSMLIMLVLDCSSSLGDDFTTVQSVAKNFISTMYSATGGDENNGGGNGGNSGLNDNFSLYSKTPIDLSLAVSIDGARYYLTQEQYQKSNLSKATIEGVTVILNDEQFIIALQNEPIVNITQTDAKSYYSSNLPTQSQGKAISARWSYINDAIKAFGGDALSSYFWTNYTYNSNYYLVYSGGGNLSSASSSSKYPVRLVKSTTVSSPIKWRDENDLKLVTFKESVQFIYSSSQWNNITNKSDYKVQGILVTLGNNKFVLSLQNEAIDDVIQSYARTTYGSYLPSQNQGKIISARWSFINDAIKAFGGNSLSNYFWSSYYSGSNYYAVYSGAGNLSSASSSTKYPVRLVYPFFTSIRLSDNTMNLYLGRTYNLTASLMDDGNIVSGSVNWSSDNPSVVSVDNNGVLTGVSLGTATITAFNGELKATCIVSVLAPPVAEAIDLGLSVKWASFNLGASSPEEYGHYYAWGETEYKNDYYNWSTYKWCKGTSNSLIKYCNNSSYGYEGYTDALSELASDDDVANVKWGANWRIPTPEEINELIENCTWSFVTQNGVQGFLVTSKKDGYTDRSIFLPSAGYNRDGTIWGTGQRYCCYLSNSLDSSNTSQFVGLYNHQDNPPHRLISFDRDLGGSVRPVCP